MTEDEDAWDEPVQAEPEVVETDKARMLRDPFWWPEPEVRARLATPEELNSSSRALIKAATERGWVVRASYSRGTVPKASNRWLPGKVVDSVMVRCRLAEITVVACWEDGKARGAWFKTDGASPNAITVTQAREVVSL